MKSTLSHSLHFITTKIIGDFLYFPVWWYSSGLVKAGRWWLKNIAKANKVLGLTIWLKNMLVPMYAEYNFWGRIISFFMRLVILIFRLIVFIIIFIFYSLLFILYLVILPGTIIMLIINF